MRYTTFIYLITILLFSCNADNRDQSTSTTQKKVASKKEKHTIAILPFNPIDTTLIKELKKGLIKQLTVECTILGHESLPPFAFYKPRQRYIADSLLVFLQRTNKNRFEKIIGITVKDISTRKGDIENWGILGLGSCPGEACVISTFRAGRNKIPYKDFLRRMTTLALHEFGHTYGLEHCPVNTCLMKDAEGKMNLDVNDSFCAACRDYLIAKAILSEGTTLEK